MEPGEKIDFQVGDPECKLKFPKDDFKLDNVNVEEITWWFEDYVLDPLFDEDSAKAVEGYYSTDGGSIKRVSDLQKFIPTRAGCSEGSIEALMQCLLVDYGVFPLLFSQKELEHLNEADASWYWSGGVLATPDEDSPISEKHYQFFYAIVMSMTTYVGEKLYDQGELEGSDSLEEWDQIFTNFGDNSDYEEGDLLKNNGLYESIPLQLVDLSKKMIKSKSKITKESLMDKTNLKSLKGVSEDLMFIADKLKEVAETLDAILGSEELLARKEVEKKTTPKPKKEVKTEKPTKVVKKATPKTANTTVVEEQPKKKRGRPAKAK